MSVQKPKPASARERHTLFGFMGSADQFHRLRLLLTDQHPDGHPDTTADFLRRRFGDNLPGRLRDRTSSSGLCGECWLSTPRHREYWLHRARELEGQYVSVEVTVRYYSFDGRRGVGLDVSLIEPVPPPS
jgi:hypothetical protein